MLDQQIAHDCQTEVAELHRFFTEWFTGVLPDTDASWAALDDSLAPEFELITPSGMVLPRDELLAHLRTENGAHKDNPGFRIWTQNFDCRRVDDRLVVVTYEEWQHMDGKESARLSTAVFERNPAMPNRVRWLHVHETWLTGNAPEDP